MIVADVVPEEAFGTAAAIRVARLTASGKPDTTYANQGVDAQSTVVVDSHRALATRSP